MTILIYCLCQQPLPGAWRCQGPLTLRRPGWPGPGAGHHHHHSPDHHTRLNISLHQVELYYVHAGMYLGPSLSKVHLMFKGLIFRHRRSNNLGMDFLTNLDRLRRDWLWIKPGHGLSFIQGAQLWTSDSHNPDTTQDISQYKYQVKEFFQIDITESVSVRILN